jgi:hypothetical protein
MNLQKMFNPSKMHRPRIVLMDGSTMSVQANRFVYCAPRDDTGPYYQVEVGFPSRAFAQLEPYAEDWSNPTETVYGYVPVSILEEIIAQCGGVNWEFTFLKAS